MSSCQKDNNDCNEAIPYVVMKQFLIIYNQYVDVMALLILIGKQQNVTVYSTTERVNVKVIKD